MHARRCESAGVCHTTINGEHETSKPYEAGDYLLIGTEGERYSIPGATFLKRYDAAHPADADTAALHAEGFRKFEATGRVWAHLLTEADMAAHFPGGSFMASWNEPFTVHAGDCSACRTPTVASATASRPARSRRRTDWTAREICASKNMHVMSSRALGAPPSSRTCRASRRA